MIFQLDQNVHCIYIYTQLHSTMRLWCDHTDVNATELINADAEHLAYFAHSFYDCVLDNECKRL